MSVLSRLFGRREDDRAALRPLWLRLITIAREPAWYSQAGIADTIAGRFDAITLVMALALLRMEREPELVSPSVRLTELFVDDMDLQLRESGVGDLVVGKHMGKLMGVLGGRLGAYRSALAEGDEALAAALGRNVTMLDGVDPQLLVERVRELVVDLDRTPAPLLLTGEIAR